MRSLWGLSFVYGGFILTTVCAGFEVLNICEGQGQTIVCGGGIGVISARYGRFDQVTCLHAAMSNVGCFADVITDIRSKCEGKTTCTVSPSNGQYGDPCPGTFKYLEVQFNCPSAETTPDSTTTTASKTTTTVTTTEPSTVPETTTVFLPPTTDPLTTTTEASTDPATTTVFLPPTTDPLTTTTEQSTDPATTTVFLPPTTDPLITTASFVKTNATCTCVCRYVNDTSCQDGELQCTLAKLRKQLTIDKSTLSSFKTKKISVYDGRTSSTLIGMVGVALITTVLALLVIPDFLSVLRFIICKILIRKNNGVVP